MLICKLWLLTLASFLPRLVRLTVRQLGDTLFVAATEAYLSCSPPHMRRQLYADWGRHAASLGIPSSGAEVQLFSIPQSPVGLLPLPAGLVPATAYVAQLNDVYGSLGTQKETTTPASSEDTLEQEAALKPWADMQLGGLNGIESALIANLRKEKIPLLLDPEDEALQYIRRIHGHSVVVQVRRQYYLHYRLRNMPFIFLNLFYDRFCHTPGVICVKNMQLASEIALS